MIRRTIREWEKLPYGIGEDQIPDVIAGQLAAVAASFPLSGKDGGGVLEHRRHDLRARGIVGVLATKDCILEILPKIDVAVDQNERGKNAEIRRRLIHMLAVAVDLKVDLGAITELDWQNETLLEILIRIFCEKLANSVRRGMPRRYLEREDDLAALRGSLDITKQFTRHAVNPSRLACRFDILSENIMLNRAMKATVTHLSRLSSSFDNLRRLRELSFVYAEISDIPATAIRWDDIVIDRTNRAWQDMLNMARLFLLNRYQTTSGGAGQGTALLFEMNVLFEKYVGRLISRALAGSEMTVSLQGGRLFCLTSQDSAKGLFQTKPDILIRVGNAVTHVIDTKWKRIAARMDDPKQGVSQADVYQMMAYGHLYRSPRLTLLYPHHQGLSAGEDIHARHQITNHEMILETASIDVANGDQILDRIRLLLQSGKSNTQDAAVTTIRQ